ncbi:type I restriction enzyme HsdR N-terminal domain-containing protein [Microcoleus sp. FACHB-831]|uniref:type I restriction enzyme HsdR N-terminal domain-containing protein n=1 Tax=Microcoleus sp. FACHB-831 TaxID=2692827 RepID=UPI001685821D|nr:type I restriction enzyme HsdR N-terminal domain-containing protein [Microcoleus sp. FACHB-831]MBD1924241.1 type I restriction enzyme HsdR N-terminal domain-containing protein [Microcoleus sp. FACHB-831]
MTIEDLGKELSRLSNFDFNDWNENDVREEFIQPLLKLLGYRKNTDYDINREEKHQLHKPFLMVGRKRIDIDYALLVRKKQFWIIEAKPSSPRQIEEKSIFQAHLYALHPEVNARYFAVINGWNIVVYDSRNIDEAYQPILNISSTELPQKFLMLNKILGAKNLLPMLKQRVLDDIRDILSVEVMEERLQEFSLAVDSILESARPVVQENRRNIYFRKALESEQSFKQICFSSTLDELIKLSFSFSNTFGDFKIIYEAFNSKFELLNNLEKSKVVTTILQVLRGRPAICHRQNLIALLVKILPNNEMLSDSLSFSSIADEIKRAIKDCLTHFENQAWLRELWKLEGNLYRVYYKLTFFSNEWFDMFFNNIVKIKKEVLEDEELVFQAPDNLRERVDFIQKSVIITYYQCISRDEQSLLQLNHELNELEERINPVFQDEIKKVHPDDRIILRYEMYNKPFDFLISGLFNFLYKDYEIVERLLDEKSLELILELIQKDRKKYTASWIDKFLVRYLFNQNRYEILEPVSSNYNDSLDMLIILKKIFNCGQISISIKPSSTTNTNLLNIFIRENYNNEGEWTLEGEVDIKDKILKITSLNKKIKYVSDPIKPSAFSTSEKTENERNN